MTPNDKPTYQFYAKLQNGETSFEHVLVKAFLPERMVEPLRLIICLPIPQAMQLLRGFEFSLVSEAGSFGIGSQSVFRANRVYPESMESTSWAPDLQETSVIATPYDFSKLDTGKRAATPQGHISGRFWLTPCRLLSPAQTVERSFTGEVKVKTTANLKFNLTTGLLLSFDFVHRHILSENGDHLSFSELVASFTDSTAVGTLEEIPTKCLDALDDFLLLASFANRHRCVCLGWETNDESRRVVFYRRDVSIPSIKPSPSRTDSLIFSKDFPQFLQTAYARFVQIQNKEFIRQAFSAVTAEVSAIELKFIRLFSALETLILKHRRETSTEFIFPPESWKVIEKLLQEGVRSAQVFEHEKAKRKQIYENFSALNRISLRSAYLDFCERHTIKLDDLWPVCASSDATPLSTIRNRLVHGEPLDRKHLVTVSIAAQNLEWIIERALLSLLGWDIEASRVSSSNLQNMTAYSNWRGLFLAS